MPQNPQLARRRCRRSRSGPPASRCPASSSCSVLSSCTNMSRSMRNVLGSPSVAPSADSSSSSRARRLSSHGCNTSCKRATETGFSIHVAKPAERSSLCSCAVMSALVAMAGQRMARSRSVASSSLPLPSGRLRSSSNRSKAVPAAASAAEEEAAAVVWQPSWFNAASRKRNETGSSSTMSTRNIAAASRLTATRSSKRLLSLRA